MSVVSCVARSGTLPLENESILTSCPYSWVGSAQRLAGGAMHNDALKSLDYFTVPADHSSLSKRAHVHAARPGSLQILSSRAGLLSGW